jgi:hypothetical protein
MDNKRYINNYLLIHLGVVTVVTAVLIGAFTVTTVYGQAQTNTVRFSTPFETASDNLCGVEPIFISGTVNFVFHETIHPNGESAYLFSHTNFQKTTAVSESGEIYVIKDVGTQRLSTTQTGDDELITISQGVYIDTGQGMNGPNTLYQIVFHVIIHPDGETITELEDVDIKCVGGGDDEESIIESILDIL